MNVLRNLIEEYLEHYELRKELNSKTIKAYPIDLRQFSEYVQNSIIRIRILLMSISPIFINSISPKLPSGK